MSATLEAQADAVLDHLESALILKPLRRLALHDYLLVALRADPSRLRRVPAAAVQEEHGEEAFVACPCGARPVVGPELEKCGGCQRWYVRFDGVWVAYGAMAPPATVD